ncbi:MAG: histidine phosphatase family protein [Synergistaceae bacterium]|jgi:probable phosphoglycerate mutase|nr:histidine phosphatase family protein [Synergistaceae bacterium]
MRFFIIRHGETAWNTEGRFQGQRDTELNERGLEQSRRAAEYLAGHKFDAVASSPLKRALTLAEMIAGKCAAKTEIIPAFTEINHGDWEGRLSSEVKERWPQVLETWHASPHLVVMPGDGGESLRAVQLRAAAAAEKLAAEYSGDVCVAAHDAVIKALICHFLDAPLSSFWSFQIANCGLTIVEVTPGKPPRMSLMGDAHYLDEGGKNFTLPEQKGL